MTDEKKFEFNEDIENDCLMTWKNARTLGRYKALCNERDSVDVKKYDCFFAFGNESFARGMKGIRPLQFRRRGLWYKRRYRTPVQVLRRHGSPNKE